MNISTVPPRHRRRLDLVLVLASVGWLMWVHFRAVETSAVESGAASDPLLYAMGIPLVYVLLATLLARAGLATAGRRGYVLSCLGGLCGVGYVAMTAVGDLATSLAVGAADASGTGLANDARLDMAASASMVLGLLHDTATHFLYPIITGIALYTVCSVFENDEAPVGGVLARDDAPAAKFDFARLAEWLNASEAPQGVRVFLEDLCERVTELTAAYQQLTATAQAASEEVRSIATAAGNLRDTFGEISARGSAFASDMRASSEGLADFRQQLSGANDEGERLTAAVGQIRHVVDELAELASHEILNLGPRSEQGRR